MKERPILFSAPMVRALLDGSKAQTRRVVKCPYKPWKGRVYDAPWTVVRHSGGGWRATQHREDGSIIDEIGEAGFPCPYGVPGDRLWVRETFGPCDGWLCYRATEGEKCVPDGGKWRPSIHMPRWASRITLTVTDVRVERLQDISEADAIAEGCLDTDGSPTQELSGTARGAYAVLWDDLNAERAPWATNPWVWVISFAPVGVAPALEWQAPTTSSNTHRTAP